MHRAISALMICLAASPALAGAWMRAPETGFSAVSATLRKQGGILDYETGVYAEYGASRHVTLGLDLNQTPRLTGHALAFLRVPLGTGTGATRYAAELALGKHQYLGQWHPMQKLTLSYGRAFDGRWGPGWLSVDLASERRKGHAGAIYKLDGTIGLSGQARVQPMLQLETAKSAGLPFYWSATPSVRIRDQNSRTWLMGVEFKSAQTRTTGLKFAIWRDF